MESYVGAKERILLLAHTVSVGPCSNVGRATCQTISTSIRETCAWRMAHGAMLTCPSIGSPEIWSAFTGLLLFEALASVCLKNRICTCTHTETCQRR